MDKIQRLAIGSIVIGTIVLVLKYVSYRLTGSVALYSDALESIINVVTAVAALMAVRLSAEPADKNHPYGHQKVEYFSAVLEGVLILVAAMVILREAYAGFFDPRPLEAPLVGLAVNGLATLINAGWSWLLIREGRRLRSPALVADGRHLLTDVMTSGGVIAGLLLVPFTGWYWLDSVLAALVAVNIIWSGWALIKESIGGLMDEALPESILTRVREIIAINAEGAIEAHDLRTRHAGRLTFIDFHLVVEGGMSVTEAHDICDRLERALKADIGDAQVTIHVEPENKAKHAGIVVL
ncbi:cation diffusion facilitator family transporter [Microvirga antarctica]|uniref:cation diffusion facilitator family transporter n=1 Tax=Microvirga antarctica TaxID=2819233 RepID=UPI001B310653|nr:cation diffusion facilitator family transporter [Microvirga antarctica]